MEARQKSYRAQGGKNKIKDSVNREEKNELVVNEQWKFEADVQK